MDYVTELENAINEFNAEAKNLANYREMMDATQTLIVVIQEEKNYLKKATDALQVLAPTIETGNSSLQNKYADILNVVEAAKNDNKTIKDGIETLLQGFVEREDLGRENLAEQVKAKIERDTEALSAKLTQPLENNIIELQNNCAQIQALIDHEQKAIDNNERIIIAFQESLGDYIKAQTDAVNGFLKQIENIAKVSIDDNAKKMQAILDNTANTIVGTVSPKIDSQFDTMKQKLDSYFDMANNNMTNLNASLNNSSSQIADRISSSDSKMTLYFDGANSKFEQLMQNDNRAEKAIIDTFNNVASENSDNIVSAINKATNELTATKVKIRNSKDELTVEIKNAVEKLTKIINNGNERLETELKDCNKEAIKTVVDAINFMEKEIAHEIEIVDTKVNQNRVMMKVLIIIAVIILFKLW